MKQQLGFFSDDLKLLKYINNNYYVYDKINEIRVKYNFHKSVYIYFFNTIDDISCFLGMNVPRWMSGLAIDRFIILLEPKNKKNFSKIIIHEFMHVVINYITKENCPLWINEGLAQYYSEEYKQIDLANKNFRSIDPYKLNSESDLLYSVSANLTSSIIAKYGEVTIIKKLFHVTDFENDDILGSVNIKKEITCFSK